MTETVLQNFISRIKAGDNQPLVEIMDNYGSSSVRRLITSMNCPEEEAKDIFIEILLDVRDKVLSGKLEVVQNLPAYLSGACRNRWLKSLERKKRKLKKTNDIFRYYYEESYSSEAYDELVQKEEKEDLLLEKQKRIDTILETLNNLSEKCQQILRLYYVEEKSMQAIALQMGFSNANTAKTSKSRCYKKWRDGVEDGMG